MLGTLGVQEILIIFLVALVLFGPKKLPELGRTLGKAITEFRRASNDLKSTFEREMQTLERESDSLRQVASSTSNEIHSSASSTYDYPYYDESGAYGSESYEGTSGNTPATHPTTVDASEIPGVESNGTYQIEAGHEHISETAVSEPHVSHPVTPSVEGAIAHGDAEHTASVETPQHS